MKVFVGNLAEETNKDDLRQAFESFGQVQSVTIVRDVATGKSQGFGFVIMPSVDEAKNAIDKIDGKDLMGHKIKAKKARPKRKHRGGRHRQSDSNSRGYADKNPWLDNEAATFLRIQKNLRAIGIDAISISSFAHLDIGEKTHQILLMADFHLFEPKFIIEDMNLSADLKGMKRVFVIPLFIDEVDSAPCTVFAEVEDE